MKIQRDPGCRKGINTDWLDDNFGHGNSIMGQGHRSFDGFRHAVEKRPRKEFLSPLSNLGGEMMARPIGWGVPMSTLLLVSALLAAHILTAGTERFNF